MKTFTFIVEFLGGTYCFQVIADSVNESIHIWVDKIKVDSSGINGLDTKTLDELIVESSSKDNLPTPLNGLSNTWFVHYSTTKGEIFVNIVQTDLT